MRLSVSAYAKINWTLDVTGIRADGYHELDMLMQSVSLSDLITFQQAETLSLTVDQAGIPKDARNLILGAAVALQRETGCHEGAAIALCKQIPTQAGMGGGSADAAAALRALNLLWNLRLSDSDLEQIGLSVGADVPFCVRGGLQRVGGIGERLKQLAPKETMHILMLRPCIGLSTPRVFSAFRKEDRGEIDTDAAEHALLLGNARALGVRLGNALEPAASRIRPEIRGGIETLLSFGACGAGMTGSGCAVFGLFADETACLAALPKVRAIYPDARALHTVPCGSEIEIPRDQPWEGS